MNDEVIKMNRKYKNISPLLRSKGGVPQRLSEGRGGENFTSSVQFPLPRLKTS